MSNKNKDAEETNYNCWNEFSAVWSAKDSGLSVPIGPSERQWSISVSWIHPYYITEPKVLTGLLVGLPNKEFLCEELRWVRLMLCRKGETLGTRQIPCSVVTTVYERKHSNALSFLPLGPRKLISLIFLMCFIQICLAHQQVDTYWFLLSLQFHHNRVRFFTRDYLASRDRRGQENNMTFLRIRHCFSANRVCNESMFGLLLEIRWRKKKKKILIKQKRMGFAGSK